MLFTFETTHHALWGEELAREAGIPVEVVPAPPAARARCNLALATVPEAAEELERLLRSAEVPYGTYSPPDES